MARLKDVAALAGVSVSVASRALTGDAHARISEDTRTRILDAASQLNYVPDHRARALRLSRSGAIALIVPEVNNAIFGSLHRGVQQECAGRHSTVLLGQLDASDRAEDALLRIIGNGRVDGVILQRAEDVDDASLATAIDVDVPVVLFNSSLPGHVGSVALDDGAAVATAIDHLAGLGHRDIGFIAGAPRHDAAARRLDAFREIARARGLTVRPDWIQPGGWEAPAGHRAATALLTSTERPTAVLVASLNAAVGALSAAAALGVRVPDELSVVSVHEAWLAQYMVPALTTVELPMAESGRRAAQMLLDHLDGAELVDVVVSDPAPLLNPRASTSTPR